MSNNAKRHHSKRQMRREIYEAIQEMNSKSHKIKGQIVITPKALLKGYVKWNAAVMRAVRSLALKWGISVRSEEPGRLVCS